ncbi:tRNA pseudouridine(13) synthase TruD [Candidatus Woesearchaeota archaeon]|nr:tRNA pseudouridine(13) synthase TruD [Candidatus Woesearchaeota archaeon]
MYRIKQRPDDFIVEEIPKLEVLKKGDYTYFLLEKRNWNTLEAIKAIAASLKVKEGRFNIAGIKDKKAVSRQYISAYRINRNKLESLKIKDLSVTVLGYGDDRLRLGQLVGNRFKIVVRDVEKKVKPIAFIENYFDDQRFGGKNSLLGKALVQKEYRKACYTLRLRWSGSDYIAPLRTLGKRLLRFYINSYQSLLFNEAIAGWLAGLPGEKWTVDYTRGCFVFHKDRPPSKVFPIVGFLTEYPTKDVETIYKKILEKENIAKEAFLMRQIPELNSEGNAREAIVPIKEMSIHYKKEDNFYLAEVQFMLPPGSYATVVIKKLFGTKNPPS